MRQSPRGAGWIVVVVLAAVVAAAGCGSSTVPSDPSAVPSPSGSVSATDTPGSLPPATPSLTGAPGGPSDSGAPSDSQPPSGPVASSPAAACSGTAENRDFFATVAGLVPWTVYCAVVPDGWYIESGQWRLRDGGRLDVTYHGPDGARVVLAEGVFCTEGVSVCTPHDQILGTAAFGDLQGELATLGGGFAIYVDPGQRPAWQVTGTNIDRQTFVGLAAALFRVSQ